MHNIYLTEYQRFHMDFPPRVSPLVRLILGRDQPYARGRIHMKTLVFAYLCVEGAVRSYINRVK